MPTDPPSNRPIGYSGFPTFGDRSFAAGDERHRELQGTRRDVAFAEMMEGDSLIAIAFRLMGNLCAQVAYHFQPANAEDPEAVEICAEFQAMWGQMATPWPQVVKEAVKGSAWGWSLHEMTWEARNGAPWLTGLHHIRQDSRQEWYWRDEREVVAMYQMTRSGQTALIPLSKALHFRDDLASGDPEGTPLLRSVYIDWRNFKVISENMLIGSGKDATGMAVAQVPMATFASANDSAAADHTSAATVLTAIKRDLSALQRGAREGLVVPSEVDESGQPTGFKIGLLQSGGQRQFNHLEIAKYFESRIARGLLVQFLMLGSGKTGSFALSADQTELLGVFLGGLLDGFLGATNQQVVARLCDLQGIPTDKRPKLTRGEIDKADLAKLGAFLQAASSAGMLSPDPKIEDHLRAEAGLPARDVAGEGL